MRTTILCLIAVLVLPASLLAQGDPKKQPPGTTTRPDGGVGPPVGQLRTMGQVYVGESAPSFELASAKDTRVKLSRFRGERVMLAFADRRETFPPYRAVAESLRTLGVTLVGVCHASPGALRSLVRRDSLQFELLSDPTGEVAQIYGTFDAATSTTRPGYVLLDRRGIVRMVLLGQALPPDHLLQLTHYALTGL